MGSRSQMLPSSVAARHSRLTQDFICFSSMLAKRGLCPSCSLIQRRVLEKKLVAMWLSKLTLAICAAVFRICSRTLPFRLCNVHDDSFDTFQEGCNSAKLTSLKKCGLFWFLVICWQALTVQSIVRGCQTWISCFVELLCPMTSAKRDSIEASVEECLVQLWDSFSGLYTPQNM